MTGVRGALLGVELFGSDIGPYLKYLHVNDENMAEVPHSKHGWNDHHFITIPKEKLGGIRTKNHITFAGGGADAHKLRNVTLYVQLQDGSWVKSETDSKIYCPQSKRNWVNSEGIIKSPIEMDIQF